MTTPIRNGAFLVTRRLYLYALVLAVLGVVGFAMQGGAAPADAAADAATAPQTPDASSAAPAGGRSMTPLIFTVVPALLALLMGWMASRLQVSRAMGMIGIHAGMVLPVFFGSAYAMVGWGRFQGWQAGERPLSSVLIFSALVLASLIAAIAVFKARPPKESRRAA